MFRRFYPEKLNHIDDDLERRWPHTSLFKRHKKNVYEILLIFKSLCCCSLFSELNLFRSIFCSDFFFLNYTTELATSLGNGVGLH